MKPLKTGPLLMISIWLGATLFWWGLAFYPTGSETPEWLNVARNVCFGAPENGLPDTAGWILLTLGPLSFLIAALVAWPVELRAAVLQLWRSPAGKLIAVATFTIVIIETSWFVQKVSTARQIGAIRFESELDGDLPEAYPRTNLITRDFSLVDQSQNALRLTDFKNETVILTFAFAHCQTVCPMLVRHALDVERKTKGLRVLIVTLDPWRDTPKSLPFLAEKWELSSTAHILSGPVPEVLAVLDQFQVPYKRNEKTGDVVHPALTYVIAPGGRIAYTFNNAPTRWLEQAVERIEKDGRSATASR